MVPWFLLVLVSVFVMALLPTSVFATQDMFDDVPYIRNAINSALEYARSGTKTPWRNPTTGHHGVVTPFPAKTEAGDICRPYERTWVFEQKVKSFKGIACRQPDGRWRIQSQQEVPSPPAGQPQGARPLEEGSGRTGGVTPEERKFLSDFAEFEASLSVADLNHNDAMRALKDVLRTNPQRFSDLRRRLVQIEGSYQAYDRALALLSPLDPKTEEIRNLKSSAVRFYGTAQSAIGYLVEAIRTDNRALVRRFATSIQALQKRERPALKAKVRAVAARAQYIIARIQSPAFARRSGEPSIAAITARPPGMTGYGSPTAPWGQPGRDDASASKDDLFRSPVAPGEQRIVHAGYGRFFRSVRALVAEGRFDDALALYDSLTAKIKKIKTSNECDEVAEACEPTASPLLSSATTPGGFLSALERGALALDGGKLSEAIEKLTLAEAEITKRKKEAGPFAWLEKGATFLAETLLGVEELGDYEGEGFERVLMLNYMTIAYLLRGERKAYNVTRRAIDWQNLEKSRFAERLRKAQAEIKGLEEEQQQQGRDVAGLGVSQVLSERYAPNTSKANTVPSAYVNPFGYYVAGMVQEFESYADPSLRDNARISYEKALELNPSSDALKRAIEELKKRAPPRDAKLLHVVVAEGLAPAKKTMVLGMRVRDMVVPIKVPIYEPVPSPIQRIEIRLPDGTSLGMLSPLADIEAIALRHEKDSEPFQNLRVSLAVVRTVIEKAFLQKLGGIGDLIGRARDAMTTPDMRSWLSLPARIHVGRFHVPKTLSAIKLVAYDQTGRPLASKDVEIGPGHGFVYVRSVGDSLAAYANKKLWVAKF